MGVRAFAPQTVDGIDYLNSCTGFDSIPRIVDRVLLHSAGANLQWASGLATTPSNNV